MPGIVCGSSALLPRKSVCLAWRGAKGVPFLRIYPLGRWIQEFVTDYFSREQVDDIVVPVTLVDRKMAPVIYLHCGDIEGYPFAVPDGTSLLVHVNRELNLNMGKECSVVLRFICLKNLAAFMGPLRGASEAKGWNGGKSRSCGFQKSENYPEPEEKGKGITRRLSQGHWIQSWKADHLLLADTYVGVRYALVTYNRLELPHVIRLIPDANSRLGS